MSLLSMFWEAFQRDPPKIQTQAISDRAALTLRCECLERELLRNGYTMEGIERRVAAYRDGVLREVKFAS